MLKLWIRLALEWLAIVAPAYWALRCLGLWLFPAVFGGPPVLHAVGLVLLIEVATACFGVTLSGGVLTGLAANASPLIRRRLCLGFFAALAPLAFVFVDAGLALEYLLVLGGHFASLLWTTRGEPAFHSLARIAAPMLLGVVATLVSLLPVVLELGVTSHFLSGHGFAAAAGAWSGEPWRPLAFGVLYFSGLVVMEIELFRRNRRGRKEWGDGETLLPEPGLAGVSR